MAKATNPLTEKRIAQLLRQPGDFKYHAGHGLHLVRKGASVSWQLRYQVNYRERWLGLGALHTVSSVKLARERARQSRLQLLDGVDPIEDRKAKKAAAALEAAKRQEAVTFIAATKGYVAKQSPMWRSPKTEQMFLSRQRRFAWPVLGKLPVREINKALVMRVLEPLWYSKPETASRLRSGIEDVLQWSIARDLHPGPNPAAWSLLGELLPSAGKVRPSTPHAAMDYAAVPAFMSELRERGGVTAAALELTVLCATRTGETLGARWDEIDLEAGLWTIPASRMKSHRLHEVPLSDAAIQLLRSLPTEKGNPHVFIGTRANAKASLAKNSMLLLLDRMKRRVTSHGFRAAFRTWAAEQTAYPDHIAELALAHAVGSGVEKAYKRTTLLQKRRQLMQLWADYCSSKPAQGEVVVPIRQKA